ncbi:hypothetical protein [Cohnella sp. WQ 127256]|uniref:hypothetical protein n=1 Tax=Cohnella sp. WQ 127256 TaxID=2938790 RepID=UPI00211781BF|nr:hypothetical protein [Cohnella sp. WQ 127256]
MSNYTSDDDNQWKTALSIAVMDTVQSVRYLQLACSNWPPEFLKQADKLIEESYRLLLHSTGRNAMELKVPSYNWTMYRTWNVAETRNKHKPTAFASSNKGVFFPHTN